jgi:hypothetical protein
MGLVTQGIGMYLIKTMCSFFKKFLFWASRIV